GATLHAWAAAQPDYATFAGRGEVRAVPAPAPGPDRRERWAVRHYRRGGAMAGHLDDRYLRLGRYRPFRELTASVAVRERGVPTPAVMAGAAYLDGIYYRADLVTEVVPTARTLADTLHATDGTRGWLEAMGAAGSLIERLGSSGVYHVDLNAHNIVFEEADLGRPWVLDLDRVKLSSRSSPGAEERMRARLTRSIVKVGTPTGERLGDREVLDALRRRASGS
ncbi:MAG: hypothetical protein GWM92_05105, partial [Gemmatimonadetes bacterium]|nr:hypothetical protein [Gemmatimonadota bacterium]NIT86514.1 hypothetical protein [Gemmatimonadota bacterium]NIU78969.1 hypothetical protein [Gammaproteobacteria bacterium]NIY12090.1 hypothetical protein [Gemmatimonadota bacterium]NIY38836.1 hypothetical protein [Gemmatimonadota bacterium]